MRPNAGSSGAANRPRPTTPTTRATATTAVTGTTPIVTMAGTTRITVVANTTPITGLEGRTATTAGITMEAAAIVRPCIATGRTGAASSAAHR